MRKPREYCGSCNLALAPKEERAIVDDTVMHPRCARQTLVSEKFMATVFAMQTATCIIDESCWNTNNHDRIVLWGNVLMAKSELRKQFAHDTLPVVADVVVRVRALYTALSRFVQSLPKNGSLDVNAGRMILTDAMTLLLKAARKHLGFELVVTKEVRDWQESSRRGRLAFRCRLRVLGMKIVAMNAIEAAG